MKVIWLFIIFLFTASATANEQKAKAYYFAAEEAYITEKYDEALRALNHAENILSEQNAMTVSLRVKILFQKNDFEAVKSLLKTFWELKASDNLAKDMSKIELNLDSRIAEYNEEQRLAKIEEQRRQIEIKRRNFENLVDEFISIAEDFSVYETGTAKNCYYTGTGFAAHKRCDSFPISVQLSQSVNHNSSEPCRLRHEVDSNINGFNSRDNVSFERMAGKSVKRDRSNISFNASEYTNLNFSYYSLGDIYFSSKYKANKAKELAQSISRECNSDYLN